MRHQDDETRELQEEESNRVKLDEILGILFFTIAILLLVGWRAEESGAIHKVTMTLFGFIGAGMWYLIVMFSVWGINKFRGRAVIGDWVQLASWIALLPVSLGFVQSFKPENRDLGGRLGWSLYTYLENGIGTLSARVLLAGIFLMLVVICLDSPLTQLVASGYHVGGKATGVVGSMVLAPVTLLYRTLYYLLCYLHVIVFVILKDLVILGTIVYDRLTMAEEPQVGAGGEAALPPLEPREGRPGLPPGPMARTAMSALPQDAGRSQPPPPVVELDRPPETRMAEPAPTPADDGLVLRVRAPESASVAAEPVVATPEPEAPAPEPPPLPAPKLPLLATSRTPAASPRTAEVPAPKQPESPKPARPDEDALPPGLLEPLEPLESTAANGDDAHQAVPGDDVSPDLESAEEAERAAKVREVLKGVEPGSQASEKAAGPESGDEEPPRESAQTPAAGPALAADLSVKTFPAPEPVSSGQPGKLASVASAALETAVRIHATVAKEYRKPTDDLFLDPPVIADRDDEAALRANAEKLVEALAQFRIQATVTRITQGPTVTQYEIKPAPGVKIANIVNLSNDIAMAMATAAIRIEAPIPGRSAVGIEIPNRRPIPVTFKEIIVHDVFRRSEAPLTFAIGKEITGKPVVADLSRMPHLLVAGATGSGKSVCINTIISSLLFRSTPDEIKFILIDPKVVELTLYDGIPNLVTEVITDPADATAALRWAVLEMERRYRYLSKFAARDIRSFNRRLASRDLQPLDSHTQVPDRPMPYIVLVIDELADLMMLARKEIEDAITRLAQMARAVGIHLVLATQRPSTNIITGVLKANLPSRIAFSVSSQVDSKVILDCAGAEKLLGSGDMLYSPIGQAKPIRLQGAFISEEEVRSLVSHLKTCGDPDYSNIVEEVMEPDTDLAGDGLADDKFADCVRIALENQEASTSMLQRHLKIGYNRAARIIEAMESRGIISGPESGRRRKLLIGPAEAQKYLNPAP